MKKVTLAWVFLFYCIILYLQKAAGKVNPYCPTCDSCAVNCFIFLDLYCTEINEFLKKGWHSHLFHPLTPACTSDESRFWYKFILSDLSVQLGCSAVCHR